MSKLRSNKGRTHSAYYPHDYVFVHKSRWPQGKVNKIQSPWFGPYLILEVRHSLLKVAVSPSLGAVIECSTSMVKKWNFLHQDDPGLFDHDLSDIELDPSSLPTDPNPENELSPEEALEQGF